MLVLTRRIGEGLHIDEHIDVVVLGVDRGQVKIGIQAPKHIAVTRNEILLNIGAAHRAQRQ